MGPVEPRLERDHTGLCCEKLLRSCWGLRRRVSKEIIPDCAVRSCWEVVGPVRRGSDLWRRISNEITPARVERSLERRCWARRPRLWRRGWTRRSRRATGKTQDYGRSEHWTVDGKHGLHHQHLCSHSLLGFLVHSEQLHHQLELIAAEPDGYVLNGTRVHRTATLNPTWNL